MVRQLWLLRHADAEPHGTRPDAQRVLTERGRRQARVAGLALRRLQLEPEAVLVSPKVRAEQTARLAAEACDGDGRGGEGAGGAGAGGEARGGGLSQALRIHPPLASGYDAAQALDDLAAVGGAARLLVVGHEPDLAGVLGALTGAAAHLKKAGLAVVRLDGGAGELVLLLRPRELAMIAGEPVGSV